MRDANIVTLNKKEEGRSDCNNNWGIAPLRIDGKLLDRVFLERIQVLEERDYPESPCGFRTKQSTIDKTFYIRKLQENCREQRQPLCISFIDLNFDLVKTWAFLDPPENRLPTEPPQYHQILSWWYERQCTFWWLIFWYFEYTKWSETGVFSGAYVIPELGPSSPDCWNTSFDL